MPLAATAQQRGEHDGHYSNQAKNLKSIEKAIQMRYTLCRS